MKPTSIPHLRRDGLPAAALAVAALLLAGVVEPHHDGPLAAHPWDGETVTGAVHPDQPAHAEKAGERHPSCPVCLFQLTTRGAGASAALAAGLPLPAGAAAPAPGQRPRSAPRLPSSSRGPPRV